MKILHAPLLLALAFTWTASTSTALEPPLWLSETSCEDQSLPDQELGDPACEDSANNDEAPGENQEEDKEGDPVDLSSGGFSFDMDVFGFKSRGADLGFHLSYLSSAAGWRSSVAARWTHTYDQKLVLKITEGPVINPYPGPGDTGGGGVPPAGGGEGDPIQTYEWNLYHYQNLTIDMYALDPGQLDAWNPVDGGTLKVRGSEAVSYEPTELSPTYFKTRSASGLEIKWQKVSWELGDLLCQQWDTVTYRPIRIADPAGTVLHLEYETHTVQNHCHIQGTGLFRRLSKVRDELGGFLSFTYDNGGRGFLERVEDHTGRFATLGRDGHGNLTSVTRPEVWTTADGQAPTALVSETRFTYAPAIPNVDNSEHRLESVTSPNEVGDGSLVPYVVNTWEPSGQRVIRQHYGGTNASGIPAGGHFDYLYQESTHDWGWFVEAARTLVIDPNGNVSLSIFDEELRVRLEYTFAGRVAHPVTPGVSSISSLVSVNPSNYQQGGSLLSGSAPMGSNDGSAHVTRFDYHKGMIVRKETADFIEEYVFDSNAIDRHQRFNLLVVKRTSRLNPADVIVSGSAVEPLFNQEWITYDERGGNGYVPPNGAFSMDQWDRYATTRVFDYQESEQIVVDDLVNQWGIDLVQQSMRDTLASHGITVPALAFDVGDAAGNADGRIDPPASHVVRETYHVGEYADVRDPASGFVLNTLSQTFAFNVHGLPSTSTDFGGVRTKYLYHPISDPSGSLGAAPTEDGGGFLGGVIVAEGTSDETQSLVTYSPVGDPIVQSDGRGASVSRAFDELRRPIVVASSSGLVNNHWYDLNGNLVHAKAENGIDDWATQVPQDLPEPASASYEAAQEYDILDHLVEKTVVLSGDDATFRYRYDRGENLVLTLYPGWETDPANCRSTLMDEWDRLFVEGHGGVSAGFAGLAANQDIPELTQIPVSPPNYAEESYDYVGSRLVKTTNGEGRVTLRSHDGFGRVTVVENGKAEKRVDSFDVAGQKVSSLVLDTGGNKLAESRWSYDEFGQVYRGDRVILGAGTSVVEGPLSPGDGLVTTRYAFDAHGQLSTVVQDDLSWTSQVSDALGRVVTILDGAGNTWSGTYDEAGNLIYEEELDASTSGAGAAQRKAWHFHDLTGRLTASVHEVDGDGAASRYHYDRAGQLVHESDSASGGASSIPIASLDVTGQHGSLPPLMVNGHGNSTTYVLDEFGETLETRQYMRTGGLGGNPIDLTLAGGDGVITTRSEFDLNGKLTAEIDDAGNRTEYGYDALNRMDRITYADSTVKLLSYTKAGDLDRILDANGTLLNHNYDQAGRLEEILVTKGTGITGPTKYGYSYDALGRVLTGTTYVGKTIRTEVTRAYDSLSNQTMEDVGGLAYSAIYDGVGSETRLTYHSGLGFDLDHDDPLGRLTSVRQLGTSTDLLEYEYIGSERVESRSFSNGAVTNLKYDALGMPDRVWTQVGSTVLKDHRSVWSAEGHRMSRLEQVSGSSRLFAYDSAYRLGVSLRTGGGLTNDVVRYTLDGVANRSAVTGGSSPGAYVLDPGNTEMNAYSSSPIGGLVYDEVGSLIEVNDGSAATRTFAYDPANLTTSIVDVLAGISIEVVHDAFGRRYEKKVDHGGGVVEVTRFGYLPSGALAEEFDGSGAQTKTYVYGNSQETPTVQIHHAAGSSSTYFMVVDDMLNVLALLDAAGSVVEEYMYEDYGRPLDPATGTVKANSSVDNRFLFAGKYFDWETGLYDSRARLYDPALGRFTSRDPLGIWGDPYGDGNGYQYAGSSPWSLTDPSGLRSIAPDDDRGVSGQGGGSGGFGVSDSGSPSDDVRGDTWHTGSASGKKGKSGRRISDSEYRRRRAAQRQEYKNLRQVARDALRDPNLTAEEREELKAAILASKSGTLEERNETLRQGILDATERSYREGQQQMREGDAEHERWQAAAKGVAAVAGAADGFSGGLVSEIAEQVGGEEMTEALEKLDEETGGLYSDSQKAGEYARTAVDARKAVKEIAEKGLKEGLERVARDGAGKNGSHGTGLKGLAKKEAELVAIDLEKARVKRELSGRARTFELTKLRHRREKVEQEIKGILHKKRVPGKGRPRR